MLENILISFDLLTSEFATRSKKFFSSPTRPDRLWGPSNLQFNYHQMHFCLAYNRRGVKLTTNLQLRTDVTNEWEHSFAAPYAFMACIGTILPFHALHFIAGFLVQFHDGCCLRIRQIELSFPWLLIMSVKNPIYNHNNTNAKKTRNIQQKFELLPPRTLHIFEVPLSISSIKYQEIQNTKSSESCIKNDFKSWLLQYSSVWHCSTFRNFIIC
jgi:hypothetical protein